MDNLLIPTEIHRLAGQTQLMAVSGKPTVWHHDVKNELLSINAYCNSDNWDGRNASRCDPRAIRNAATVVDNLSKIVGIAKPIATLTADGNVGFCWDDGVAMLDLEVGPAFMHFVYINRDNSKEIDKETDDFREIAELLTSF